MTGTHGKDSQAPLALGDLIFIVVSFATPPSKIMHLSRQAGV